MLWHQLTNKVNQIISSNFERNLLDMTNQIIFTVTSSELLLNPYGPTIAVINWGKTFALNTMLQKLRHDNHFLWANQRFFLPFLPKSSGLVGNENFQTSRGHTRVKFILNFFSGKIFCVKRRKLETRFWGFTISNFFGQIIDTQNIAFFALEWPKKLAWLFYF